MKLRNFALTLTSAALLPAFAYAGTDAVVASFERDLNRDPVTIATVVAQAGADPLDSINNTLNQGTDAVAASFERDLYHDPVIVETAIAQADADPLAAINVAFRSEPSGLLASFYRDLHRAPTTAVVVLTGEADPLAAINVALWNDSARSVAQAAIANSNRYGS